MEIKTPVVNHKLYNSEVFDMDNFDVRYEPTYDPASVQYMRDELTAVGFSELLTLDDVDNALAVEDDRLTLLVVNSVCGCAAGCARPGIALALQHNVIPDRMITAFAGMEKRVVEYLRQRYLTNFVPSSPVIALFRNGRIEFIMERKDIVHKTPEEVSDIITAQFDRLCKRPGPSIDPEQYNSLDFTIVCSSTLPRYQSS